MATRVKICGLTRPEDVIAVAEAGADYAGFVFFPKSPRNVSPEVAADLAARVPEGIARVALLVNPEDALLDAVVGQVPLEMIQLHGAETPERVAEVKARYGLPVMKALGVATAEDVARIAPYEAVVDQLLVDAKAPKGAALPGGNGLAFDWRLLEGRSWAVPWMLAGGLTPETAAEAVRVTGATQLDVSSGVESAPGVKDAARIAAFVQVARGAA